MKGKKWRLSALLLILALFMGAFAGCGKTECLVLFDVNCPGSVVIENEPDPATVLSGGIVAEPDPAPARKGYVFSGWYTDQEGTGDSYNFESPVAGDLTLYAKWEVFIAEYTVTFDYNDASDKTETQKVSDGGKVTLPSAGDTETAFFDGWYIDEGGATPFGADTPIVGDLTLYAKWTQAVTLTFDYNYANAPAAASFKLRTGAVPQMPANPVRADFTFMGWYTDRDGTASYQNGALTGSKTVYAKWEAATGRTFTVLYHLNYTDAPVSNEETVDENGTIDQTEPRRDGYRFDGWYTDSVCETPYAANTPVTRDLDLYAKWTRLYTLTLHYNYEGAVPQMSKIAQGDSFAEPADARNPNPDYKFSGWAATENGLTDSGEALYGKPVTDDITLYAQWEYTFVYEAEDIDFDGLIGAGWSGGESGTGLIQSDTTKDENGQKTASNGYYVGYTFMEDLTLTFTVISDRAITGAKLTARLSAEIFDQTFYSSERPGDGADFTGKYTFRVNGIALDYGIMDFLNVPGQADEERVGKKGFTDIEIGTFDLKEGENIIELITDNNVSIGGTTTAMAPMVDCVKITTVADLTWTKFDNY